MGSDPHEPREGEEDVLPYRWIRTAYTVSVCLVPIVNLPKVLSNLREIMFRPKKKRKTGEAGAGEAAAGLQAGEVTTHFSAAGLHVALSWYTL